MALFKEKIGLFDVTNLVVGAVVGADIYVATGFGMKLVGPLSLLVWIVAGIFAVVTAMAFSQCAHFVQKVGGPYAYVHKTFGHFAAYMTGWSLWLAEIAGLCVFPLAFVAYLSFFNPEISSNLLFKGIALFAFVNFLFWTNFFGIKKAARANDVLTAIKLLPLLLIIVLGLGFILFKPASALQNFLPFAPLGWGGFGSALVLIFWAFVGFEIATLPAGEVKNPRITIPKAIVLGMTIVTVFYLLTNLAIVGVAGMQVAESGAPLALAGTILLGGLGAVLISIGAIFSVSGSDESNTIGTTRLAFALAADGYMPKALAKLHPKFQTPYISLAVHSAIAFFLALFFDIRQFIIFSTFNFALCYFMVTLAAWKLNSEKHWWEKIVLIASALVCIYLVTQIEWNALVSGIFLLAVVAGLYPFASKMEVKEAKELLQKDEHVLARILKHEETFLAHPFKHVKHHVRRHWTKAGSPLHEAGMK
ncbi:MAG: amino acid permease [Candidatus Diapherotrites archaeon]